MVNPRWEWNPALLHLRARLEEAFLRAVRPDVGQIDLDSNAAAEMDAISLADRRRRPVVLLA
jgi:hypothetical protein